MFCIDEIEQWLDQLEKGIPVFSSVSIDKYMECAEKMNLVTQYFPIVDSGFIVYKDKTIILIAQDNGTRLSIKTT